MRIQFLIPALLGMVLSAPAADSVQVTQPVSTTIRRTTSQPATALPFYSAGIHSRVEGVAGELLADIGSRVSKGQELLRLEVPELQKAMERAQAQVRREDAEITRAEASMAVTRARVEQATAEIQRSEAQVAADQSEFDRASGLVERGVVNAKLKDEAANRLKAAQAELSSMKQSLNVARALLSAAEAEVLAAKASRMVAQKSLEERQVLLEYGTLRAPFDGIITERNVDPGDLVGAHGGGSASRPLFVVDRIDKLRVRVPVPEKDALWVSPGDPVEIRFSADPATPVTTQVSRTSGALDPATRTLMVEMDLSNPDGKVMAGMYGNAVITLQQKQALVIPAETIRHDFSGDSKIVYVVRGGKVVHVPVVTGLDDGISIEVVSGLTSNDRIVTGMIQRLADGQTVEILTD